jgi:hypothetical protein
VQAGRRCGGPAARRLQAPPWAVDGEGVLLLNPSRPAFLSSSSTAFPPSGGLACRTGSDRLAQRRDGVERPPTGGPQFLLLLSSPPASPFFFFLDSGSGMGMALAGCASPPPAAKGSAPGRRCWPPPLPPSSSTPPASPSPPLLLLLAVDREDLPWGGGAVQGGRWGGRLYRAAARVSEHRSGRRGCGSGGTRQHPVASAVAMGAGMFKLKQSKHVLTC